METKVLHSSKFYLLYQGKIFTLVSKIKTIKNSSFGQNRTSCILYVQFKRTIHSPLVAVMIIKSTMKAEMMFASLS